MKSSKILLLIALLLPAFNAEAVNLGEAREVIRFRVHDTTNTLTSPRWDDRALNTRINLKHRQVCAFTNCLFTRVLISPVTSQAEQTLPDNLKTIVRVTYQQIGSTGNYKSLLATTMSGLDRDFPTWERDAGLPLRYYRRANKIGLHPKPTGSYAYADALKIDYYAAPYSVSFDTDTFFNGDTTITPLYDEIIISGVVADLKQEAGMDYSSDLTDYKQWLNAMKDMIKLDVDRQDSIRVNYRDESNAFSGGNTTR